MYLAVKEYLTTNAAAVNPLPHYPGYAAAFWYAIGEIQSHGEAQRFDKSGLRANKDQLQGRLKLLASDASRKLQAYARYANNQLLLSETKYTDSVLKNSTDNELRDIAQGLYDRAQSHLPGLEAYGLRRKARRCFWLTSTNMWKQFPGRGSGRSKPNRARSGWPAPFQLPMRPLQTLMSP